MFNISLNEHWGIVFFRLANLHGLNVSEYFTCLRNMKPLFENSDFLVVTPSFYINRITNVEDDRSNSLRLTYFAKDELKTKEVIKNFLDTNQDIRVFPSLDSKEGQVGNAASEDNDEELRFRIFAGVYSSIGLDLLEPQALSQFRNILSNYIARFWDRETRIPPEETFSSFFDKNSSFFKDELDNTQRTQLWEDLTFCPRSSLCFPHFLINMFAVLDNGVIDK